MKFFKIAGIFLVLAAGVYLGKLWQQKGTIPSGQGQDTEDASPLPRPVKVNESPAFNALNNTEEAIIQLFEKTAPSVCFISTSNVRQNYWTRNIFEVPRGTGSGFVWDKDGHIVTNYHVIKGADRAQVTLADKTTYDASLVGVAPDKDLAVLKIDAPRGRLKPIVRGDSDNLRVGQFAMAIGNPFGLDQTLTTGVISALDREIESQTGLPIRGVIQTDAAINPGNSGGPLINSSGQLIGVNTMIYSPSGASAGIGFSIPAGVINWVVPELIKYGKIKRPSLGVQLLTGWRGVHGAIVGHVVPGSDAEKAGLRPTMMDQYGHAYLGDVIVAIDDTPVKSNSDLILALEKYKPGEKVKLTIMRDNKEREISVKLAPPKY